MNYKLRNLNLLDIRYMAKILKEIEITKDDFRNSISDIFTSAMSLSKGKNNEKNIGEFIKACLPALDGVLLLFAESDTFWNFLASLLQVEYEKLSEISLSDLKNILMEFLKDEQVTAFFTSISKATQEPTAK